MVLLTGRSTAYVDIINRMLNSRDLKYHLVVLKPKLGRGVNNSTLTFKYAFIGDMLRLGESIDEVEVYEDRAPHRDAFENYLKNWRRVKETKMEEEVYDGVKMESLELVEQSEAIGLKAFKVHYVQLPQSLLDEEVEESLIRTMVEETNEADMADELEEYVLEKKVFNLGYMVQPDDFQRLFDTYLALSMAKTPSDRHEWRNIRQPSVFIHFNALPHILNKVGGIGKQVEFEVTHLGVSDKVLALGLAPIASYHEVMNAKGEMIKKPDSRIRYWSKNDVPVLVLATRNGGKPVDANHLEEWTVIPKSIENRRFMTRVATKQEISLERVPKGVKDVIPSPTNDRSPRRRSFHQYYERKGASTRERTASSTSSKTVGGSHYGVESSRGSTRNGFGYSLG